MEQKTFLFELKAVNDDGSFEGYASYFGNEDLDEDVVVNGAFTKSLEKNSGIVPMLWQHHVDAPLGWGIFGKEDERGLFVKGEFTPGDARATSTKNWMKKGLEVGAKIGLSIGYNVLNKYFKNGIRYLSELDLLEWSIVVFPANPLATVTAIKSVVPFQDLPLASEDRGWDASAAMGRVKKWAGGPDKDKIDWAKFRKAHLWYDESDAQNFGSYKLPIADVVGDELQAVPRGIFAAAGRLGSTQIPDEDKQKVQRHLSRYYKKLDKPAPWDGDGKSLKGQHELKMDFDNTMSTMSAVYDHRQQKRMIDEAHSKALQSVYEGDQSLADKKTAVETINLQHAKALTAFHHKDLDMGAAHTDAGGSILSFDPWANGYTFKSASETMETKAGRAISASNGDRLDKATKLMETGMDHHAKAQECMKAAHELIKAMVPSPENPADAQVDADGDSDGDQGVVAKSAFADLRSKMLAL